MNITKYSNTIHTLHEYRNMGDPKRSASRDNNETATKVNNSLLKVHDNIAERIMIENKLHF